MGNKLNEGSPLPSDWVAVPRDPVVALPVLHALADAAGLERLPDPGNSDDAYPITGAQSTVLQWYKAMLAAAPSVPAEGSRTIEDDVRAYGTGFTLDGQRIDPSRITVVTAPEPLAQGESDFVSPYPVAPMGHGLVTIGEGHINGVRALIFGNRGSGVFGEEGQGNRRMEDGETICAITFATPESVELLRLYVNAIADSFDVPDSLEHPRPPLQFPPNPPQPSASVSERARELFEAMLSAPYGGTTMGDIVCAETTRNRLESAWLPIIESALTTAAGGGGEVGNG